MSDGDGSRRSRWGGLAGIAVHRVKHRTVAGEGRQTLLAVAGIAVSVALVLLVTSIAMGLAAQETLPSEETDYWLLPEEGRSSSVIAAGAPQFGDAHRGADRLREVEGVADATPALVEVVRVESESGNGSPAPVYLVGLVPSDRSASVVGLPTARLQPDDPHFANGSYDGPWTGEAVVSRRAATALNVSAGDGIRPAGDRPGRERRSLAVTAVRQADRTDRDRPPVVVAHLSEVQSITGGADADRADQFLVDARDGATASALDAVYDDDRVLSGTGSILDRLRSDDLSFAMSVTAMVVVTVVGTLFIVTTVGFELVADAKQRAVMGAVGVSATSRAALLVTETFVTAAAGGVVGVALWAVTAALANAAAGVVGRAPVAVLRPAMAPYGFAVAIGIALLASPVLLSVSRDDVLATLNA